MPNNRSFENYYTTLDACGFSIYYYVPYRSSSINNSAFKRGHRGKYEATSLSKSARKRLKRAINTLVLISNYKTVYDKERDKRFRFKINFITLTLPADTNLTDKEVKSKVLGEFLRKWKKRSPGLLYIWKAEVQDNNRIHFHLTTNKFIHYRKLRERWNRECEKHGIKHEQLGVEANSTDVHSVKNVKSIAAYLSAYMSKKDLYKKPLKRYFRMYSKRLADKERTKIELPRNYYKNLKRKVEGRKWDCSKSLNKAVVRMQLIEASLDDRFDRYINVVDPTVQDDFIAFWAMKGESIKMFPKLYQEWRKIAAEAIAEEAKNVKQTKQENVI